MTIFLDELNDSQREAVTCCDGPSLVIAGAGSGKTRVLTYKIAYLMEQGMAPWRILALTFTNKAAREMRERIAALVGAERARDLWMGTFHSIFRRILQREHAAVGVAPHFTINDQADTKSLMEHIIKKEMRLEKEKYSYQSVGWRISAAKNRLLTAAAYAADATLLQRDREDGLPAVADIYARYEQHCRQANVMDFDDLLLRTFLLFRDHEDIRQRYKELFQYVLVDEYQDTNYAQHRIVSQLTDASSRICVVGDDAQSIYGFRGAEIGNILQFSAQYAGAKVFKLECNYRSTGQIVKAANSVISHNSGQIKKDVYSNRDEGEKITVMAAATDKEEAQRVAKAISKLARRGTGYGDMAILYRTNGQGRQFEEALRLFGIPYRIYGGISFYQRREVKNALAYFKLAVNRYDEEALRRIIDYPKRKIGDKTKQQLDEAAQAAGARLWDVVADPEKFGARLGRAAAASLQAFAGMIEDFAQAATTETAYDLARRIIKESGMHADIYADQSPENVSRQETLQALADSIRQYERELEEAGEDKASTMADFLSEAALLTDADMDRDDAPCVTLMTVHAAKGLEYEAVFVTGMEDDLFPNSNARTYPPEMEEERRLFYVALTRAKTYCYLSYARTRWLFGNYEAHMPSPFLEEIDPSCLRHEGIPGMGFTGAGLSAEPSPARQRPAAAARPLHLPERKRLQHVGTTARRQSARTLEEAEGLRVGQHIEHERFGRGEVLRLEEAGETTKATVRFDTAGEKALLLKFARFKIIG